jgi:hypothetical protein
MAKETSVCLFLFKYLEKVFEASPFTNSNFFLWLTGDFFSSKLRIFSKKTSYFFSTEKSPFFHLIFF